MPTFIFFFLPIFNFLFALSLSAQSDDLELEKILKEAHAVFQQGEETTNYQERRLSFNQALFLYHSLEQKNVESTGLYQIIGELYFQFGEYPWALLYYERALKQEPSNAILPSKITEVKNNLALFFDADQIKEEKLSLTHIFFSLSKNSTFLIYVTLFTFLSISLLIWFPRRLVQNISLFSIGLLCWLSSYSLFCYYSSPVEGVLIRGSGFYRSADQNQTQITSEPLPAGTKVKIVQINSDGNWVKIKNQERVGYIPTAVLRPI